MSILGLYLDPAALRSPLTAEFLMLGMSCAATVTPGLADHASASAWLAALGPDGSAR